jgi:hypothetical protein
VNTPESLSTQAQAWNEPAPGHVKKLLREIERLANSSPSTNSKPDWVTVVVKKPLAS